jgi:hypothetical protein
MKVMTFGHRRSGNHFVMATLEQNFVIEKATKCHKFYSPELTVGPSPKILIVRDGRDTLTACYHWWKSVRGSRKQMHDKNFRQFIRGEVPPISDFKESEFVTNPIDMWVNYMSGWVGKLPIVRFEDLKNDLVGTLERVESELNLKRRKKNFSPVTKLVGYSPRKGIVGDWENHFSTEDLNLFWAKAGPTMTELGYTG